MNEEEFEIIETNDKEYVILKKLILMKKIFSIKCDRKWYINKEYTRIRWKKVECTKYILCEIKSVEE